LVDFTGINRDQPEAPLGDFEQGAEISDRVDAGARFKAQREALSALATG
jgi:hypothetical protein